MDAAKMSHEDFMDFLRTNIKYLKATDDGTADTLIGLAQMPKPYTQPTPTDDRTPFK